MRQIYPVMPGTDEQLIEMLSTEHMRTMLDYFAEEVDYQIQNALTSEIMTRYAELSKQLEIKNGQLAKSDASLKEAQKIALLGSWELELASGQVSWSDTMQEVLELDLTAGFDIRLYTARIHPEDLDSTRAVIRAIAAGTPPAEHQCRLVTDNGQIKWVDLQCVVAYDDFGDPVSVHGTIQDITVSKATEARLQAYNDRLEELVFEKVAEVSDSQMATIYALVKLAESRDDDTGDHIGRTSEYCRVMAEKLQETGRYSDEVNAKFIETIAQASPLHDIGKVGIPDAILQKPGKLTPEEFKEMKQHVIIGYETLEGIQQQYKMNAFIRLGIEITLCHHEKWDGSGYPIGLQGEQIPLSARIMALADVYDALRSKRVYKDSFPHDKSLKIITEGRGRHFDPFLTDIFIENNRVFCDIYDNSLQADEA